MPFRRFFIVPVFLPHMGCTQRCVYCDQRIVTGRPTADPTPVEVRRRILEFLSYRKGQRHPSQIAFYGGNFLGLERSNAESLLAEASRFVSDGAVEAIRFSTRPDTISPETLRWIAGYPVTTVEIGTQSMDDQVLSLSRRGHSAADTEAAVSLLKRSGYRVGVQIMIGLPGDSPSACRRTAARVSALRPDFVRIYPTVVLRGSTLARWWRSGAYTPWTLERSIATTADLCRCFSENDIPIIRIGLQANNDLISGSGALAGPFHPAFGHMVKSECFLRRAVDVMGQTGYRPKSITFRVHPRKLSEARGLKNRNLRVLAQRLGVGTVDIRADETLPVDEIRLDQPYKKRPGCSSRGGGFRFA